MILPTYRVTAKVDQIVTREIQLEVKAGSEEEAEAKARDALNVYPEPNTDSDVVSILPVKQHFWIPKSVDFTKTKKVN